MEIASTEPEKATFGLDENIAGALSYLFGFITGLIFFIAEDENSFVRFHAMQSIIFSGSIFVITFAFSILFGWMPFIGLFVIALNGLIGLAGLLTGIFLIIKAFKGERYRLPVIGRQAENYSKK